MMYAIEFCDLKLTECSRDLHRHDRSLRVKLLDVRPGRDFLFRTSVNFTENFGRKIFRDGPSAALGGPKLLVSALVKLKKFGGCWGRGCSGEARVVGDRAVRERVVGAGAEFFNIFDFFVIFDLVR